MGALDKIFAPLAGRPLLAWSVEPFIHAPRVEHIVLVLREDVLPAGRDLVAREGWTGAVTLCPGGARRQDSVAAGLAALGPCAWVLVHDGARPCLDAELIEAALDAAQETGAAVPGLPVADTVKRVDASGLVRETVSRAGLWAVQTPQAFRYAILRAAYGQPQDEATDDAALVERLGVRVRVFPGSPGNVKVTRPPDLVLAEAVLRFRQGAGSQVASR
ncbi:MAG: 2-C-methyl-D-erythritol 4-phosphate cytidylyltransferase [Chloroflexi bacterium]|nr:2-C-methyl-D-erythritol 4-phosphate cytidylyltransferase [Chloroflexota bacterium]